MVAELAKFLLGISHKRELYLPASRTGMLLLYKYFFSEKDKMQSKIIRVDYKSRVENELGLTAPVYDFLQFLLRYVSNEVVPLYLSSSMVNELTPIIKALTGATRYDYFMYDEIENCLHPQKQQEMARLLNRMNNKGYRLIVSTHSDTMATKLNNLFLLSFDDDKKSRAEKLEKLHLTTEDLLDTQKVSVYQFVNKENGKSEAKEIEFRKVPYTGYDFSLFTKNSLDLYEEAKVIVEDK